MHFFLSLLQHLILKHFPFLSSAPMSFSLSRFLVLSPINHVFLHFYFFARITITKKSPHHTNHTLDDEQKKSKVQEKKILANFLSFFLSLRLLHVHPSEKSMKHSIICLCGWRHIDFTKHYTLHADDGSPNLYLQFFFALVLCNKFYR